MVYIVNRLDETTDRVVSVAYNNNSVWDAKGLAIRYIKCFILDKDGKEALTTAFDLQDDSLPVNEPINRYSFKLNNDGCLEVEHITASIVNGWLGSYRDVIKRVKVFTLSVSSVDSSAFQTATFVPFKHDDLFIKNNEASKKITGDEDDLSVKKSLMTELRDFIIEQRSQVGGDGSDSESDSDSEGDDDSAEAATSS